MVRSGRNLNLSEILCMSFVACKYKKYQIKNNREKVKVSFFPPMGAFCCHGNQSFDPIRPKISLSPTPGMLHITFDQDLANWLQRHSGSKVWNFCHSRASNSKMSGLIIWFGPKSNSTNFICLSWLPATLMMIWSKINKLAWRHHFPIISLWEIFKTLKGS